MSESGLAQAVRLYQNCTLDMGSLKLDSIKDGEIDLARRPPSKVEEGALGYL
ncbi:hypothetical protein [Bradyrhizobium sp. NAS80.1]|uniref:hypothetical protein n=1 Tax=Bradyrhizobium sp. NAS80.1 TaxID=1680159 RepID=UPI00143CCCDE|nr:hypothetical protein [Bradyrhizobium sp. NAS80.1]